MGGLASALALAKEGFNRIDVYEYASDLGFVGAGIQLAPNMARILDRLGVWEPIAKEATNIKDTSIRQGATNQELGHVELGYIEKTYGYPHMVGHRFSLANSMYEGCKKEKAITFYFNTKVESIDSFGPKPIITATPRDGSPPYKVEADVLLAADGIKSLIRVEMLKLLGVDAEITNTNQAAYRIMIHRDQIKDDPELLALLDSDTVTRWIGEKRHIIAYPVSNKTIYNLSTAQPDTNFAAAPSATYTTKGSKTAMLGVFDDFSPMIHRMLNYVPEGEVCEWKLRVHAPLPTWIYKTVALVGDACHPTLPHLAQGAAQAIEDGAVIAVVLSRLPDTSPESINKSLRVYEQVRKERAETLVELAAASGRTLHLGDGAAKEERDKQFAALKQGNGKVPDKWADADVQKNIYGFDCTKVTEDSFDEIFSSLSATNGPNTTNGTNGAAHA
ncbi:putative monooxygenase [Talaromyces proteolyticus]|uniref:Monooxygenase n=1 Tax=Talaromyces proteolyticus TaxID=1131652 RepID=A0AAD4KXF6_9EURO|nr:putative monooxygenase [Talaromyces proteolyticus]KAH8699018.1 putative monooxygenase [Talaromyces proteolyticus]